MFQKSNDAVEYFNNHPFFKKFVAMPSTETYIEGLCNSLQSLCIGSPVKQHSVKRRLSEILTEETSSDEETVYTSAKRRVSWDSESEDDDLAATSTMSVEVAERSSSPKKKSKKKQKKAEKH